MPLKNGKEVSLEEIMERIVSDTDLQREAIKVLFMKKEKPMPTELEANLTKQAMELSRENDKLRTTIDDLQQALRKSRIIINLLLETMDWKEFDWKE